MATFERGFYEYYEKKLFTDLDLVVGAETFHVHQLLFASSSTVLNRILTMVKKGISFKSVESTSMYDIIEDFKVSNNGNVTIVLGRPFQTSDIISNTIPQILEYLYKGKTNFTLENIIMLIFVAEKLDMHLLLKEIDQFVSNHIKNEHVGELILPSMKYKVERLISHLIELMATNFSDFVEESHFQFQFSDLPYEAMIQLVNHPNLFVAKEGHIFQALESFLSQFKEGEINQDMLNALYENVRFEYLEYSVLESALNHPMVPKALLSQALMLRLATVENKKSLKPEEVLFRRRRSSYGRVFQPSDIGFDSKGVLYYIATGEYKEPWENPFLKGIVAIEWSSLEKGSLLNILEKEPKECWSQDVPSSWVQIDLGVHRSLRITHYSLRHGGNSKQDLIRNWILKASIDGIEYDTLKRHKDDESLSGPFEAKTWPIIDCKKRYRFFRIVQTGHNSSKHNFLSISGIELFGELICEV